MDLPKSLGMWLYRFRVMCKSTRMMGRKFVNHIQSSIDQSREQSAIRAIHSNLWMFGGLLNLLGCEYAPFCLDTFG